MIKKDIIMKDIDKSFKNMNRFSADIINSFFYWFLYTQRTFNFYDRNNSIVVRTYKCVSDVSFVLTDKGSNIRFTVSDLDNDNRIDIVDIDITDDGMTIKQISTCTRFDKEYDINVSTTTSIDASKKYRVLFNIIKDLMRSCILKKANHDIINGGIDIDKTILDRFFGRNKLKRYKLAQ